MHFASTLIHIQIQKQIQKHILHTDKNSAAAEFLKIVGERKNGVGGKIEKNYFEKEMDMGKKDGMYFYNDWLAPFEKLEKAQLGELVIAMMKYFISGEEPPVFDGMLGMAADFIFPQIDRSIEYARKGSRGGHISKRGKSVNKDTEDEVKEVMEDSVYIEDDTVSEESGAKCELARETLGSYEQREFKKKLLEDSFDKFWRNYPKKAGRKQAFDAFMKLSPDSELLRKMIDVMDLQKKSEQWQRENGRYIPNPSNWIEGRRWEDETRKSCDESFDTDDFFNASVEHAKEKYSQML